MRHSSNTIAPEPRCFGPPDATLFGWFHRPAGTRNGLGVVLAPPLGREHASSHGTLRHLAGRLAAAGHPVLRFDYHGTGDSAGSDWDPDRVEAWLASVGHAVREVRRLGGVEDVALVGLRVGALLAAHVAAREGGVAALVLWAPVPSGRAWLREVRALAMMVGEEGDLPDGSWASSEVVLTAATMRALAELDLARITTRPAAQALVLARDDAVTDDARGIATHLRALGVAVAVHAESGARELVKPPHDVVVPEAVLERIAGWLGALAPPAVAPASAPAAPGTLRVGIARPSPLEAELAPPTHEVEERPFHADGDRLFGILALPAGATPPCRPAIVLANAGSVYRVGPNRLHVTLARLWAARGFPVLRFDLGGIGDSRPAVGRRENDPYPANAVGEIAAVLAALRATLDGRPAVLMGLCSGAHAAFHAALELDALAGVVLVNPVVFHWKPGGSLETEAYRSLDATRHYRERLRDPAAWRRAMSSGAHARHIARTLLVRWGVVARAGLGSLGRGIRRVLGLPAAADDAGEELRRIVARGTDVMLLFSRDEPGLDFLLRRHRGDLRRLAHEPRFALQVLPHAGHTLSSLPAQRDAASRLTHFLLGRFAAPILGGSLPVPGLLEGRW